MDTLKQIKGPVWIVLIGSIIAIGLAVVATIRSDKKLSELPAAFITIGILVVGAIIMMYAVHCVYKGGCNIFAWVLSIFIALLYILPTGLFAKLGFSSVQSMLQMAVDTTKKVTATSSSQ
jgi:hypothetical protein